jgi:hypothetical protein
MRQQWRVRLARVAACIFLVAGLATLGSAYSVLTHEEVVDLLWRDQIVPMLLKKYPGTTVDGLRTAHAYAYGGSMIQDMGYYPFGNKYFSDLLHYVRSGDFVENLIDEASDVNEYAFSLGALAHYAADTTGHPTVNRIVALEFPSLRAKYGDNITYAQDPKAHIRTEFGLDVEEVAKNRFGGDVYHDFIGFEVSQQVLERAFEKTYGIKIKDIFGDIDLSIGTYRYAVSGVIPAMTKAALVAHEREMKQADPHFTKKSFRYRMSRKQYETEFGKKYRKPGLGTRFLAWLLRHVPKVGPFRALAFRTPTAQEEKMYLSSLEKTESEYRKVLIESWNRKLDLPNKDFDTGRDTKGGEYVLTDRAYARLLDDLAKHHFTQLSPELQKDILTFYANLNAPIDTKRDKKKWRRTLAELDQLKSVQMNPERPAVSLKETIEPQ